MARILQNSVRKFGVCLPVIAGLAVASTVSAATQLHFDINNVTANVSPTITAGNASTYTGTVTISMNTNSSLEGIDIDNAFQTISGTLTAVSGTLNYSGGAISTSPASTVTFTVKNSDNSLHTYTGTFDELDAPNPGALDSLDGDVDPSHLDSTNFAGVDVTPWALQDLDGSVILDNFTGTSTNLEVYLEQAPEPTLGLVGLGALMAARGRKRRI
jgi:hypothetical protein